MRCSDVTQELAAPTGALDSGELGRHLAACPACAAWTARADRLDRLWAATRPAEPSDLDFERVWTVVTRTVDEPRAPGARRLPMWGMVTAGLALAAAALLAVFPLAGPEGGARPRNPDVAAISGLPTAEPVIEVEAGQVLIIHVRGDDVRIVRRDRPEDAMEIASADVAADFELWVRSGAL